MELKIRTILFVAHLNSDTGCNLDQALSLAQKYQAKIHVIYCFDIMKFDAQSRAELYMTQGELKDAIEDSILEEESHIRGQLQYLCHERLEKLGADSDLIAEIDIERKTDPEAVLSAAAERRADLIVLCSHRQPGTSNFRLNPTSVKILQRATVPVFVVKGDVRQLSETQSR